MPTSTDSNNGLSVLICIRHFHPTIGGAEIQALRLAKEFQRQGISVEIVTGRYGDVPKQEMVGGVCVRRLFIGIYIPIVHELFFLTSFAGYLFRTRSQYDLIQLFQLQLSTLIAILIGKLLLKKPVITRASNTKGSGVIREWQAIPFGRQLLGFIARRTDAVIALSNLMVDELRGAGFPSEKIVLIPNGVPTDIIYPARDEARKRFHISEDGIVFLTVGRLTATKRHGLLIDALALCSFEDFELIILGQGEELRPLQIKVRRLQLEDKVRFLGEVENVFFHMAAADIFVLPSAYEGMSNALLEAMVSGLPVVASAVSGTLDVIMHGKNGMVFEPDNLRHLVQLLDDLARDAFLRQRLGKAGRQTVREQFSMSMSASHYLGVYNELVRRPRLEKWSN